MLTKYQAAYLIAPLVAVLGVFWLRSLGRGALTAPSQRCTQRAADYCAGARASALLGVGVLVFSPHMIRNAIFYKNPLYPLMREVFPSTPNVPHSAFYFDNYAADPNYWVNGSALGGLANAIWLFFTFYVSAALFVLRTMSPP